MIILSRIFKGTVLSKHPNRYYHEVEDLKGNTYGELTVVEYDSRDKWGRAKWLCKCSCGKEKVIPAQALKSGATISCGHVARQVSSKWMTTYSHKLDNYKNGFTNEPWASCYSAMYKRVKDVCTGKDDYKSNHYRQLIKGKLVEIDWLNDPYLFYKEIEGTYQPGYSIHRIDNHKGYIRGNVCWASKEDQSINRDYHSFNKSSLPQGITLVKHGVNRRARDKYLASITVNCKTINFGYYYRLQDAMIARYYAECKYGFPHHYKAPSLLHPYQLELPDIDHDAEHKKAFEKQYGHSKQSNRVFTKVEQWNADHTELLNTFNSIRQAAVATGVNRKKIAQIAKTHQLKGSPYDWEIIK